MKELNLGLPSKNLLEKGKKFQRDAASFMDNYNKSLRESEEAQKLEENKVAMSGARFGYSSTIERSKNRVNSLNEEIKYNNTASIVGMTEMIATVVENALLLDEEEYSRLNPNYKEDIRDIISGMLQEAEINREINNYTTLQIMEYVARQLPDVKVGKTLTEDELRNIIAVNTPADVDASIASLSRNVAGRVAGIVEAEQRKTEKINKEVGKAKGKAAEEAPVEEQMPVEAEQPVEEVPAEEVPMEQEAPVEEAQPQVDENGNPVEEMPVEGEQQVDENGNPVDPAAMGAPAPQQGKSIHIGVDGTTSISMPNGQLSLNNDGSMDIQLMEDVELGYFVAEEENDLLMEASASQVKSNSAVARKIKSYLEKYGVKFTWRINKHIAAVERLYRGDVEDIKLAMVAMPLVSNGYETYVEGTRIILFTDDKIMIYGKGILSGAKARTYQLASINDILIDEGLVWARVGVRFKQKNNALESSFALGRINKKAVPALENFLKSHTDGKFQKTFDQSVDEVEGNNEEKSLRENKLVRETMRCGLLESLAVNEAKNMLAEGRGYNPDLCFANAIMYVTITEAMNEMGLMNIGNYEYSQIISAAGGNVNVNEAKKCGGAPKKTCAKKEVKKESLTESVITQWGVQQNKTEPTDLAERLRQKRLNQSSKTLHD